MAIRNKDARKQMPVSDDVRAHAIKVNKEQRQFYDDKIRRRRQLNLPMLLWEAWRNRVYRIWDNIGVFDDVLSLHREWVGDLSGKRVLDLGCYSGNRLSLELASRSTFYLGLDLSEEAIAKLRAKLDAAGLPDAQVRAKDFLDRDLGDAPFDVIYANAVLHHFKDFDLLISLLADRLVPGGRVISFDPMETALTVRIVRSLYRPFQRNAAWEWPFKKRHFDVIETRFTVDKIQGVVGLSKWVLPFSTIPFFGGLTTRLGRKLHERDLRVARQRDRLLWRCMSVNLHLVRRT
jgi:SAM-dependent methyltransferase